MTAVEYLGWLCALGVIVSYFFSIKLSKPIYFHRANIYFGLLLFGVNMETGSIYNALLNIFFVSIGLYGVWREDYSIPK